MEKIGERFMETDEMIAERERELPTGGEAERIELFDDNQFNDDIGRGMALSVPRALIYPYWWEEELVLFFADNGVGKSILATQIAEYIATGKGDDCLSVQTPAQKVLYFDFELHLRQLAHRYGGYRFSENLRRLTIRQGTEPEYISALIVSAIEEKLHDTGARVCIVDNISWLSTQTSDTEAAKTLMGGLHRLVRDAKVAMMAIAHCPKVDDNQPINKNMLGGAKALSDFADGVFALGRNRQGYRYLKLLKTRMVKEPSYDTPLPFFSIAETPYLMMRYEGSETEMKLLYGQRRQEFFNEIWGEDKSRKYTLPELIKLIVDSDHSNAKDKAKNARERIRTAIKNDILHKDSNKIISLN